MKILIFLILLINIIFFIYNIYTNKKFIKEKNQKQRQQHQLFKELANERNQLIADKLQLQTSFQQKTQKINSYQSKILKLKEEKESIQKEIQQQIETKNQTINQFYNKKLQQEEKALNEYINNLNQQKILEEEKIHTQIQQKTKEVEQYNFKIIELKSIFDAATAARIREQEEQEKKKFYQIQITNKQISDINKLENWKRELYDPSIVAKIIWSSYIMKPTSDMCNRVIGSTIVCGIYKITNILTNDIYIGQSVNISDRFKNHIKCGLGIDASSTNKLYNNMQEYGVWNFTFELLQKCSRDKLNEKERFWIDMYQSNKIGMNLTKGNK